MPAGQISWRDAIEALGFAATVFLIVQNRSKYQQEVSNRIAIVESRVNDLWSWFMGDKQTRQRIGRALDERDERNGGHSR